MRRRRRSRQQTGNWREIKLHAERHLKDNKEQAITSQEVLGRKGDLMGECDARISWLYKSTYLYSQCQPSLPPKYARIASICSPESGYMKVLHVQESTNIENRRDAAVLSAGFMD